MQGMEMGSSVLLFQGTSSIPLLLRRHHKRHTYWWHEVRYEPVRKFCETLTRLPCQHIRQPHLYRLWLRESGQLQLHNPLAHLPSADPARSPLEGYHSAIRFHRLLVLDSRRCSPQVSESPM